MQDPTDHDANDGTHAPAEGGDPTAVNGQPTPGLKSPLIVVGVGASAGGLEALEQLVQRLASDGMAFIVCQHLAPDQESLLTELLARHSALKVVTAEDRQVLARDTIYVGPPGMAVSVERGVLRLSPMSDATRRHPIDAFMCSLARDCGVRSIGVLLSGAGSDGSLGLRCIKDEGGITFAQDPKTARHASMPQSAVDAGCADFVLSPAEISNELMRMSTHPLVAVKPLSLLSPEILGRMFRVLRHAFGLDFSGYKLSTIERRIVRRMALVRLENANDYATLVEENRSELHALYSDLLIGVTSFFRDKETFEALKTLVFPRMVEGRHPDAPLRIWVAGCATGEEAYSIVISLLEYLDGRKLACKIQVFATDINEHALAKARHGTYPSAIELDVSEERLRRFFLRVGQGYQVAPRVRDLVVFAGHNLGKDPPFSKLDLVSCRNVLIYLQPPLQKKVIRSFHYALGREGTLMLGASESVGEGSDLFSLADRELKFYVKKNVASNGVFDFSVGNRTSALTQTLGTSSVERKPVLSVQQLADRKVLDKYAPVGVIVDEGLQITQFRGQTAAYFHPSPGVATLNVLRLVRPELMITLRNAIQAAVRDNSAVSSELVATSGGPLMGVEVIPLREASDQAGSLLILFRDQATPGQVSSGDSNKADGISNSDERIQQLQRELSTNKEYLETIIHELETANEELQSANEELQSANEELQSANEEVETSKEELQSSNEELATVNEELHTRMGQLANVKDDLVNVLTSISIPIVIVGSDLRIRRFSAAAERELSLISGDVGRPVSYLAAVLNVPQLELLVAQTIDHMHTKQQNIRCSNGSWYSMRTTPNRTSDHVVSGVVIELLGTPSLRRPSEAVDIHELVGKVLSTLPHALVLLDDSLRIIWANRAFFDGVLVGGEAIGQPLDHAWNGRDTHPKLWNAIQEAAFAGKPFSGLVVEKAFGRTESRPMTISARCIASEADRPPLTLVVIEESAPPSAVP